MSPLEKSAMNYAISSHNSTNHLRDGQSYEVHLRQVVTFIRGYDYLTLEEFNIDVLLAAGWCHDLIEDARQSYNDVKKVIGFEATEIVYALTTEKGRTRKERANEKYYQGILDTPGAIFVKICDRLANVKYSKDKGSKMLETYRDEHAEFCDRIWIGNKYDPMFEELNKLLDKGIRSK